MEALLVRLLLELPPVAVHGGGVTKREQDARGSTIHRGEADEADLLDHGLLLEVAKTGELVPKDRVGDLVPHHMSELCLVVQRCEQPGVQVHGAVRHRERIDRGDPEDRDVESRFRWQPGGEQPPHHEGSPF